MPALDGTEVVQGGGEEVTVEPKKSLWGRVKGWF